MPIIAREWEKWFMSFYIPVNFPNDSSDVKNLIVRLKFSNESVDENN